MNVPKIITGHKIFLNTFNRILPIFQSLHNVTVPKNSTQSFFSHLSNASYLDSCKLTKPFFNPLVVDCRGFKVKGSLTLRCKNCYFVRKDGVLHVDCTSFGRHKQKQLQKRERYSWILTYAFQSKKRPY